jgi:hypothetical protein
LQEEIELLYGECVADLTRDDIFEETTATEKATCRREAQQLVLEE